MRDVIIVGGGLFGSIAAAALRGAGMDVMLIDDGRPRSGSRAAGCLMKPSWLSKMGKDNVDASFRLLDRLYGLRTVPLRAGPLSVSAEWINPDIILGSERVTARVAKVATFPGGSRVRLAPTLEALGRDYAERLPIGKLDIDQAPATAARMGIRSVPTLILFRDGRPLDRLSGVRSGAELQHWIDSTLAA